jgi:hypothetical protein
MNNYISKPKEDIQAIREIMERSSRFLSLSGMSGIFAGICTIIGAAVAWIFILNPEQFPSARYLPEPLLSFPPASGVSLYLALDAILVLVSAFWCAVFFSKRKARKAGQQFWTLSTRRLFFHLLIPLFSGGFFTLILAFHGNFELVAASMLIFYGLSLVNAGKFTLGEIHYLGLTEILLGILAGIFMHLGLLLWTIGFGLMHILYGTIMYYRYEHERSGAVAGNRGKEKF